VYVMKQVRQVIRVIILGMALTCAMTFVLPPWLMGYVTSLSPFLACMTLLTGAVGFFVVAGIGVGITCLFMPRFFCHWICPAGTCQSAVSAISPFKAKRDWIAKVPQIGKILFLIAAGGAIVGYPLFIWLDPLSLFLSSVGALARWKTITVATGALGIGLPLLLVYAFFAPGLWCRKICLAGALQDLLWRVSIMVKQRKAAKEETLEGGNVFGRRAFIGLGLGAGYRMMIPRRLGKPKGEALRPPWSLLPGMFESSCARCGACVRACPSRIIMYGGIGEGLGSWLAPEVEFENGRYCPDSCSACGEVCPTGAIGRFTTTTKSKYPLGILEIDHESCRLVESGGCGFCIVECPRKALSIVYDKKLEARRVQINLSKCNGCGKCLKCCPVDVMRVIRREV
jgi:ferredoxin-type protein NapF